MKAILRGKFLTVKIKKEESLKRGERFNMFETLGVAHYEVMHSAIIASFLDPMESHGQGDKFLRVLFDVIDGNIMPDTSNASVYTEYSMNDGRIDILIEDHLGMKQIKLKVLCFILSP